MEKSSKKNKGVESEYTDVCVEARADTCVKPPIEMGVIVTGKKVYRLPLLSIYKEMDLPEDLNDGMEWVIRYYGKSLRQEKNPLPPRDEVMEFDGQTNTKESENNLKLQGFFSDL